MNRLRQFVAPRRDNDEGSLLLAALMSMVLVGLVLVMLSTVTASTKKSGHSRDFAAAFQAADAGAQEALFEANQQHTLPVQSSPKTGTVVGGKYSWYATNTPTATPGSEYYIYSTGTVGSVNRTLRVWIISQSSTSGATLPSTTTTTTTATTTAGLPTMQPRVGSRFVNALLTNVDTQFRGGNVLDSYDSRTGATNTGRGIAATNGTAEFRGSAAADGVILDNYSANPNDNRCTGTPCSNLGRGASAVDLTSPASQQFLLDAQAACASAGRPAVPWRASQQLNQTLTPVAGTGRCYSSMNFDVNTTVTGTPSAPVVVYVTGDVIVGSGVSVNYPTATATPVTGNFVIYSTGKRVALGNSTSDTTTVVWALWAPNADCAGNPSNAHATIYGAMVCSTVANQGGWQMHYDDSLGWDSVATTLPGTSTAMSTVSGPTTTTTTQYWSVKRYAEV